MTDTTRLFAVLVAAVSWHISYKILADKVIFAFLPGSIKQAASALKKQNNRFALVSSVNGTAFIHACIVAPISLYVGFDLLTYDPWETDSAIFEVVAILMSGYFLWDIFICYINIEVFGYSFLIHALFSFIGLYAQISTDRCRMLGLAACFAATEISTPFLHCRYVCTKTKQTKGAYFYFINTAFVASFLLYRMIFVPLYIFRLFWVDLFQGYYTKNLSLSCKTIQVIVTIGWTILNYYWGTLIMVSQFQALTSKASRRIKTS